MARQNNYQYWAQLMKYMEEALLDQSYSYVQNLDAQFARAQAEIEKQITVWYRRFAVNNEITLAEAKRLLNSTELAEFQWSVQEYIKYGQENALDGRWMRQLENASAKVHISRLEAIKLQIQQQAEVLYSNQLDSIDAAARMMYEGSYYGTAFEVQRGLGVGWTMHAINEETITKVLSRPWTADNQTFRDRCWTNKQNLVNSVNTNLTQMIIRGEAPDRAITAISKQFDVSRQKAGRLVMTESAYFASAAQKDCFTALDVERYRIVASFDHDTCELCGALDGKVFKMSEYQVGLTAPPFHPWCRCCTCPYFEDMAALGERWTRNADGTTAKIKADTTFEEWKQKFVQPVMELPNNSPGVTIAVADTQQVFSSVVRGQNGMTQNYGDALEQRFSSGTDAGKQAFTKYVGTGSVADSAYTGTPHFSAQTRQIKMDFAKDAVNPRGAGTTFFHEHGHFVDYLSNSTVGGYTSTKGQTFGDLLRSDFDAYIQAVMKANKVNKTNAYALVSQEVRGHLCHSVSDILGGLSKNRCMGSYGHRTAYWSNHGAVEKEAFAHMFEAQFSADKYALMQKYFPAALAEFERLLAEVIK